MSRNNGLKNKIRDEYYQIRFVKSPAFNKEPIYFNRHGLRHMFQKQRLPRNLRDQYRRLRLLPKAVELLKTSETFVSERTIWGRKQKIHFWILEDKVGEVVVRVIVRQLKNGSKHFYSVMNIK